MKYANKIGARYTVIIGADELAAGKANIKIWIPVIRWRLILIK